MFAYDANVLEHIGEHAFIGALGATTSLPTKRLVLGVELETNLRRDQITEKSDLEEHVAALNLDGWRRRGQGTRGIMKEDATCNGLEFVSLPADLEAHKTQMQWSELLAGLRPVASGFNEDCGIHVHINKRALSPLLIGKMLVFLNCADNRIFTDFIAQRNLSKSSWARRLVNKTLSDGAKISDKYEMLHVGPQTCELRIFRANLLEGRFFKCIEFADALVNFCKKTSQTKLSVSGFVGFVDTEQNRYPNLHTFIKEGWQNGFKLVDATGSYDEEESE